MKFSKSESTIKPLEVSQMTFLLSRKNEKMKKKSKKFQLDMQGCTLKNTHAKFELIRSIRSISNSVPNGLR